MVARSYRRAVARRSHRTTRGREVQGLEPQRETPLDHRLHHHGMRARSRVCVQRGIWALSVATWTYRLTATPTGCHVTESWTDTRGGIIRTLGKLVTGVADRATHNRDGMEQTLAALATAAAATAE